MSNINLQGIKKDSFGKNMPNVFINRVTIDYTTSGDPTSNTEFTFLLSIKFTKPEHFQDRTTKEFIEESLSDIYLYAFLTPQTWIKNSLNNNQFSLKFWHSSGGILNYLPNYIKQRFRRIPLWYFVTDLWGADNPYKSALTILSTFDEEGNEIIEISNINLTMEYGHVGDGAPSLDVTENLMFFAYTGPKAAGRYTAGDSTLLLDDDGLFSNRFLGEEDGYEPEAYTFYNDMSANIYFGDISYYHVLNKNRIATKFFEAYTDSADIPYYGEVLQSTNGNFYSTENYSFQDLKLTIDALIDSHNENREADVTLDKNIKNLEAIINAEDNRTGVLTELSTYRATYPDKSPTALSGQFYSEFVVVLAEIIQSVQAQEQLNVKQLYDSLVVDNRYGNLFGIYTPPSPSGKGMPDSMPTSGIHKYDVQPGVPYSLSSPCYIPSAHHIMSRNAIMSNLMSVDPDVLDELYNAVTAAGGSAAADLTEQLAEFAGNFAEGTDYISLVAELRERYISEGLSEREARDLANDELSYYFATTAQSNDLALAGSVRTDLLNPELNGGSRDHITAGDVLVQNTGMFFFDYERALRTQSMIAHVFNITRLQELFRINIPYEQFYVKKVELSRNELRINYDELEDSHDKFIRVKMQLNMVEPSIYGSGDSVDHVDYPKNGTIDFKYFGGKDSDESESELDILAHKLKYMRPTFNVGGSTYNSFLYFVNFDFPVTEKSNKLRFYKSLDGTDGTLGDLANSRVLDGYRLMAFKYRDAMDDDVAAFNAPGPYINADDEELMRRIPHIEEGNSSFSGQTVYSIVVEVVDQTQMSYDTFVNYLKRVFNEFIGFYEYASEFCSFNNLTNEFNRFFVDSMSEKFPDKPWLEAAYVATALSELMFNGNAPFDEDLFDESVLELVIRISPDTGNLFQLTNFAKTFKGLIDYVTIEDITFGDDFGPSAGTMTPRRRLSSLLAYGAGSEGFTGKTRQFYSEHPISAPIAGDITPGEITLDDLDVAAAVSVPVFATRAGYVSPLDVESDVSLLAMDSGPGASMKLGELYPDDYFDAVDPDRSDGMLVNNALRVFENVFYPSRISPASGPDPFQRWYKLEDFTKPTFLIGADPAPFEVNWLWVSEMPGLIKGASTTSPDISWFCYYADKIMRYSSTDISIKDDGYPPVGRLKIGIPSGTDSDNPRPQMEARQEYRDLTRLYLLLNRLYYTAAADYNLFSRFTLSPDFTADTYIDFVSTEYFNAQRIVSKIFADNTGDLDADGLSDFAPYKVSQVYRALAARAIATLAYMEQTCAALLVDRASASVINFHFGPGAEYLFNTDNPLGPVDTIMGNRSRPDESLSAAAVAQASLDLTGVITGS